MYKTYSNDKSNENLYGFVQNRMLILHIKIYSFRLPFLEIFQKENSVTEYMEEMFTLTKLMFMFAHLSTHFIICFILLRVCLKL
jgi:hypothetical protein